MRAVNLIPVEERRGGAGGGSGPPTVWLLVGLGILVVALAGFVLASNQVSARQAKLAQISTQADSAQASVAQLTPYVSFAALAQTARRPSGSSPRPASTGTSRCTTSRGS